MNNKDRKLNLWLWNYFQPMHEHLGFENAKSISKITLDAIRQLKLNVKCVDCFRNKVVSTKIHYHLMNPKSKMFLRGLLCETKRHDDNKKGVEGFYYFIKRSNEQNRIKDMVFYGIRSRTKQSTERILIQGNRHLQQLDYKPNKQKQIENK